MIRFIRNLFNSRKQICVIPVTSGGSTDYLNENYEYEIIKCFYDCLREVNMNLDLNIKRVHFSSIFQVKHRKIFDNYNEIESDDVVWNSFDGNVILLYRPFRKIEYTHKIFYIQDMFGVLT